MTDWYTSSATFATQSAWQALTGYTVGQFVIATAPTQLNKFVFRCTTTGTTAAVEPTWPTSNNGTVTDGTAHWTNVTGQSAYFWTAASGDFGSLSAFSAGDRIFVSSDHSETITSTVHYGTNVFNNPLTIQIYSVNRAGSTPPVTADLLAGATVINTGTTGFGGSQRQYWYGVTFQVTGTGNIEFWTSNATCYFKNCAFWLNTTTSTVNIAGATGNNSARTVFDNTTVQFGHISQTIIQSSSAGMNQFFWINTATPLIGAIVPTTLFGSGGGGYSQFICKGVDFSSFTNNLVFCSTFVRGSQRFLFQGCKVSPSATLFNATGAVGARDIVEFVNCYDGTNIINSCYQVTGTLTTDTSVTMVGGSLDHNGHYSHKLVSNANANKFGTPLDSFWLDIENIITGTSKTATIEIISSTTLNNDEISFWLEYQNTAGTSMCTVATTLIGVLDTPSAVTSSGISWNNPPATPQTQHLQITFTPQNAGRVRGQVRLGKPSTTVWINPQILIT